MGSRVVRTTLWDGQILASQDHEFTHIYLTKHAFLYLCPDYTANFVLILKLIWVRLCYRTWPDGANHRKTTVRNKQCIHE